MSATVRAPSPRAQPVEGRLDPVEVASRARRRRRRRSRPSSASSRELASSSRRGRRSRSSSPDALLGEEVERRERHLDAPRREPDDHRGARRAAARPTRGGSSRAADRPRTRGRRRPRDELEHRATRVVAVAASHGVGRAARAARASSFAASRSTATMRLGAREPRGRDDLEPDAAAADHADAVARRHPGRVAHRAEAGHDAAAEQRRLPERQLRAGSAPRRRAGTTQRSAKHEHEVKCWSCVPSRRVQPRRAVQQRAGPRAAPARARTGSAGPRGTARQAPHEGTKQNATAVARRDVVDALRRPPRPRPAPSWPSTIGRRRRRGARRRGAGRSGRRRRPRRARAPRPRRGGSSSTSSTDERRAGTRSQHGARVGRSCDAGSASSASRSGSTPSPGPAGGAIVPSGAISSGGGEQPVAPLRPSRPAGRTAPRRTGTSRRRSARWRFATRPSPFDHVCGENMRPQRSASAAIRRHAADAAREHDVGLDHVDAAAQDEVARLVEPRAPSRPPRAAATCAARSARVAVDVVGAAAAPRASTRRAARARARTASPSATSQRRLAVAGHAPALVRVDHELDVAADGLPHRLDDLHVLAPVGVVEAELDRPDARVAQCARRGAARSSGATSSPLDAYARRRSRAAAEEPPQRLAQRPGRPGPRPPTSAVHGRPPWKSTVSQSSRTTSVRSGSSPTSRRSSSAAVGQASPPLA